MEEIIKDHDVMEGWHPFCHCLYNKKSSGQINKAEFLLLLILFKYENRFNSEPNAWFFLTNEKITKIKLISENTLLKAKKTLKVKNLIDYKSGRSHKASEYRILIDGQFYFHRKIKGKENALGFKM